MSIEPWAEGTSLWLMPGGRTRTSIAAVIERLAVRLGTATFEPHVTLLPGLREPETDLINQARLLAAELEPLPLDFSGVDGLDAPFRCLFLKVRRSLALREAYARACSCFGRVSEPSFDPHLSLVYGSLDPRRKRELRSELETALPPCLEVRHLGVWRTEGPVGAWRERAAIELGSGRDV